MNDFHLDINIEHFGDTKNAPYGSKSEEKIADLTVSGVKYALQNNANMVFIACNTASTQYAPVMKEINKIFPNSDDNVVSIIDATVNDIKSKIEYTLSFKNEVNFVILATPKTVQSNIYTDNIARYFHQKSQQIHSEIVTQPCWKSQGTVESLLQHDVIALDFDQKINLYYLAPANWVNLIELGADIEDKKNIVGRDLALLQNIIPHKASIDMVGEFCTHYPVFDDLIRDEMKNADNIDFIQQGPIMAALFEGYIYRHYAHLRYDNSPKPYRNSSLYNLRPNIVISGQNIQQTRKLAQDLFSEIYQYDVKHIIT